MTKESGPGGLPYRPCAGVVLINHAGLIFAGERIDTPGAWQMPQGGIDPGETPREAGLRELVEETGVSADQVEVIGETSDWITYDLPPELLGKVWKGKYCGQKQKWLLLRFLENDSKINIATDHPEFDRWQWMTPDALIDAIVPFKRDVYRQVFAAFSGKLG